jgi:hypothetical protein
MALPDKRTKRRIGTLRLSAVPAANLRVDGLAVGFLIGLIFRIRRARSRVPVAAAMASNIPCEQAFSFSVMQ